MAKQNPVVDGTIFTFDADLELVTVLGARSGQNHPIVALVRDLPQVSVERLLRYGFQRFVNDGLGGADVSLEDKITDAKKKIEALKKGEVAQRKNVLATVDLVAREAYKLLRADLKKSNKPFYDKLNALPEKDQIAKMDAILALESNAKFLVKARAVVAARAEEVTADTSGVDL